MEQLFPDWNKAAERTRDAEISPSLKDPLKRAMEISGIPLVGYQGQSKVISKVG